MASPSSHLWPIHDRSVTSCPFTDLHKWMSNNIHLWLWVLNNLHLSLFNGLHLWLNCLSCYQSTIIIFNHCMSYICCYWPIFTCDQWPSNDYLCLSLTTLIIHLWLFCFDIFICELRPSISVFQSRLGSNSIITIISLHSAVRGSFVGSTAYSGQYLCAVRKLERLKCIFSFSGEQVNAM